MRRSAPQMLVLFVALAAGLSACGDLAEAPPEVYPRYDGTPYVLNYGDLPAPHIAADNQLTVQGVKLGRMLFYEKRLSRTGTLACASCHKQEDAFADIRQYSLGVDNLPGHRHAMAAFNLAWNENGFFWDGRAPLLRNQVLMPIQDHLEMDQTLDKVVETLSGLKLYRDQFMRAFGSETVTALRVSLALEQFLNSVVSWDSKYDRYLSGTATLTPEEERGRWLFFTEYNPFFPQNSGADCQHCHSGKNFENDEYANNGLDVDANIVDWGRGTTTGLPGDRGKFKVPSLRNVGITPPYMHDGRFATLEEVVEHYNSGIQSSNTLHVTLQNTLPNGLMLSDQDKAALVAFLHTLTDETLITNPAYSSPF